MRKLTSIIAACFTMLVSLHAQNNVGIGIQDPLAKLHIHGIEPGGFLNGLRISTDLTDSSSTDGFLIQTISSGATTILNYENAPLALGTNAGTSSLYLMPDQKLGFLTLSPDSAFSIKNLFQVGGGHGDLIFADDHASITFPATTAPNNPMIQMFSSGSNNANRMVIAHSAAQPDMGLEYRDNLDQFRFGLTGSNSAVTIGAVNGHLSVGNTDLSSQSTLLAASTNDATTGHFINTNTSALPVNAVYGSNSGNGSGDKRAGFFENLLGTGRSYGVYATSALADTNIAIYGSAGFFGGGPDDVDRAAWFDDGDVVVDDQMLIGSSSLTDEIHSSALLELNSTTRGLRLPRMTAAQRMAISPAAEGLLVYDTDSAGVFVRKGASWASLTGGVGGTTIWSESGSPAGPYVSNLQVGVGTTPEFFRRMDIESGTNLPYALDILSDYSGGLGKYGLRVEANSAGTNTRYGIYTKASTNVENDDTYGIYAEGSQGITSATVYGIYARASGTGSGARWAGYFDGDAMITDEITVNGDQIKLQPTGYFSGSLLELADDDGTATIVLRGNQIPGQGAELVMTDDDGNRTFQIDAENPQGGSQLVLSDESVNTRIYLRAKEAGNEGADFRMYNESNALSIELDGDVGANGSGGLDIYDEDGTRTIEMRGAEVAGQGAALKMFAAAGGTAKIELDSDFNGDGRVITDELEIKGGSDLAEYFEASGPEIILPGQVVVIDPDNPGQVMLSTSAYDKKVVGIVSGANGIEPGMLMGQKGTIAFGDLPVAIAGRVYVQADQSKGAIEPGDFLTTSDRAGSAMVVNDWDKSRGSILGKALTSPDANGYVLVLVHLQ